MVRVSIVQNHHFPQSRNTTKGVRYFQSAYVHLGGAYPHEIEIPLKTPADAFPVGDYEVSMGSFRVGKFKNLELNPFELRLEIIKSGNAAILKSGS